MSRKRRNPLLILAGIAVAAAAVVGALLLHEPEPPAETWEDGLHATVRIIDGDRAYDIELTDFPVVEGRVSYEGPEMVEGEANWKDPHSYRGVDLGTVIDETIGLENLVTLTAVALDGWHKTMPSTALDGANVCGRVILALSKDGETGDAWDAGPLLVFLPEDERFSNQDMLDALGPEYAHYFGTSPSTTGLLVKGVTFLVVNYDGGALPTLLDL